MQDIISFICLILLIWVVKNRITKIRLIEKIDGGFFYRYSSTIKKSCNTLIKEGITTDEVIQVIYDQEYAISLISFQVHTTKGSYTFYVKEKKCLLE
jgi:hypothetical protein